MIADLKKIFTQSLVYSIGTMAPKLAGLILIPLFTKHFPVVEFGMIGLLDSTSQIIISVLGLALYQGFFRWYFEKDVESKRKSLFFSLVLVHLVIALLALAIIWPLAGLLSSALFGTMNYSYLIRVMSIASLLQMVVVMPSTLMRLQERAGFYTISNLGQMIVMVLVTLYLIIVRNQGIEAIYHAQIIGLLAYAVLIVRYMGKNSVVKFEKKLVNEIFRFCLPLVISTIAVVLLNQADRFIINSFGKLGDVGLYTLASRLSNTLNLLLVASVSFAIQPIIYKKMNDPENKRFYSKLMTYIVFIIMFFVLGMTFFGKEIVKLFSKREEYFAAFTVIPILSFAILINMMKDMALIGLQITKKTGVIAVVVIVVAITGIVANLLLVPYLNNYGAALARLIANLLFFFLVYYYSQKAYPIPYETRKLVLMITLGAILYLPVLFINEETLWLRILIKVFLILLYPFLLYIFGFFESRELQSLKGAWKKWKDPASFFENLKGMLHQS